MSAPEKKKEYWEISKEALNVENEMKEETTSKKKHKKSRKTQDGAAPDSSTNLIPLAEPSNRSVFGQLDQGQGVDERTSVRQWKKMDPKDRRKQMLRVLDAQMKEEKARRKRQKDGWDIFSDKGKSHVTNFRNWKLQVLQSHLPSARRGRRSVDLEIEEIIRQIRNNKKGAADKFGVDLSKKKQKGVGRAEADDNFTLEELINLVQEDEEEEKESMASKFTRRIRTGGKEGPGEPSTGNKKVKVARRMQALREMCVPLRDKRAVRHALVKAATGKRDTILNEIKMSPKEQIRHSMDWLVTCVRCCWGFFNLWEKDINRIRGHFGAVYANFFIMLRRMIVIQLLIFMMVLCFIILPQEYQDRQNPPLPKHPDSPFHFTNLLTGEGSLHATYLFYSGYSYRNKTQYGNDFNKFPLPAFRFVIAMALTFFLLTMYIFNQLASVYHTIRQESKLAHLAKNEAFKQIFCGWDFNARDTNTKIQLQKTIRRELYLLSRNDKHHKPIDQNTELKDKRILAWFTRKYGFCRASWAVFMLANAIVFCLCFVTGVITWFLHDLTVEYTKNCIPLEERDNRNMSTSTSSVVVTHSAYCPNGNNLVTIWTVTVSAIVSAVIMTAFAKIIVRMSDSEYWDNPSQKIYITVIRGGLVAFTRMMVTFSFYLAHVQELVNAGFSVETFIGKELYRLVIFHCLYCILYDTCMWIYHWIRSCPERDYNMTEFRTEYYALMMFYLHSISIFGTLFFPPISVFILVWFIVDFYRCKYALFKRSTTVLHSNKVGQLYTPFLLSFFTMTFISTSVLLMFYMYLVAPSKFNGPFLEYDNYSSVVRPDNNEFLAFLVSPQFLLCLNGILISCAYLTIYWSRIYPPIIAELNEKISGERRHKNLIMEIIYKIIDMLSNIVYRPQMTESEQDVDPEAAEEREYRASFIDQNINHVVNEMHAHRMSSTKSQKGIFRVVKRVSSTPRKSYRGQHRPSYHQLHGKHVEAVAARQHAHRQEATGCAACAENCAVCCEGLGHWIASLCRSCRNGCKTDLDKTLDSPESDTSIISATKKKSRVQTASTNKVHPEHADPSQ